MAIHRCDCLALVRIRNASLLDTSEFHYNFTQSSSCFFSTRKGPVVPNGIGIGYIIKDHGIQFSVSSKQRQTERYVNSLEETLKELSSLLKAMSAIVCAAHSKRNSFKCSHLQQRVSLKKLYKCAEQNENTLHQISPRIPRFPSQLNVTANAHRFSNVVQKKTLCYVDIQHLGDELSFAHVSDSGSESSLLESEQGESGIW